MDRPHLRFLGTGTAFHADGRGSQCFLVEADPPAPFFLVDRGPTAMAAVMRMGVELDRLDRLFITHLHGDHVAGWPFLLLHLNFIERRSRPLDVHGPQGVRGCLEGLMLLCYRDIVDGTKLGFEIRYHELPVTTRSGLDGGGLAFDVLPMDHHPSSIGYRFDLGGRTLGVTGDTRWCANLEALARRSDVFLVECTSVDQGDQAHVSLQEIREKVDSLGDCRVVLVHLPDEVAAELAADPIPRVIASHDGMIFPL